jgi:transposase
MPQPTDLSRSLVVSDQDSTLIAVVVMSQSSWLVGGALPGIDRQPREKLEPSPERVLAARIAGVMRRSGPVEKTDRLDTELLKRASLGWLRGECGPGSSALPTLA